MAIGAVGSSTGNATQTYSTKSQTGAKSFAAGFNSAEAAVQASIANAREENAEDTIPYPIGSESFTETEWDNFLESFDTTQDVLRQMMREKHQKQLEKQIEREELRERELKKRLLEETLEEKETHQVAKVETSEYHALNPNVDICYTTLYAEKGEQLRKAGMIKKYEWS